MLLIVFSVVYILLFRMANIDLFVAIVVVSQVWVFFYLVGSIVLVYFCNTLVHPISGYLKVRDEEGSVQKCPNCGTAP
jgi:hypothetical protein